MATGRPLPPGQGCLAARVSALTPIYPKETGAIGANLRKLML